MNTNYRHYLDCQGAEATGSQVAGYAIAEVLELGSDHATSKTLDRLINSFETELSDTDVWVLLGFVRLVLSVIEGEE